MCPCDTWTMEDVTHGKMNSRVRGSFLSLEENQTVLWGRGEERKREKKIKEKKRKKGKERSKKMEEEENREWRRKEKEQKKKRAPIPGVLTVGSRLSEN